MKESAAAKGQMIRFGSNGKSLASSLICDQSLSSFFAFFLLLLCARLFVPINLNVDDHFVAACCFRCDNVANCFLFFHVFMHSSPMMQQALMTMMQEQGREQCSKLNDSQ